MVIFTPWSLYRRAERANVKVRHSADLALETVEMLSEKTHFFLLK
jgi:hypothetical protein